MVIHFFLTCLLWIYSKTCITEKLASCNSLHDFCKCFHSFFSLLPLHTPLQFQLVLFLTWEIHKDRCSRWCFLVMTSSVFLEFSTYPATLHHNEYDFTMSLTKHTSVTQFKNLNTDCPILLPIITCIPSPTHYGFSWNHPAFDHIFDWQG